MNEVICFPQPAETAAPVDPPYYGPAPNALIMLAIFEAGGAEFAAPAHEPGADIIPLHTRLTTNAKVDDNDYK